MKRLGGVFPHVVAFSNLLAAARRAIKGKRGRPSAARFLFRLEPELLALEEELVSGAYRPGRPVQFVIHDPKTRAISVAPLRDRVVHHAVIAVISPWLERRFDPDSGVQGSGVGERGWGPIPDPRSPIGARPWAT